MLGVAQRVVLQRPLPVPTPVLIGTWSFDETGGTTFADSAGTVDGTFVGTWDDLTTGSMVTGVPGTSAFKAGTAYGILPAGNPAHDLSSLTISIYVQRGAGATRQTVLAIGQDQPGDLLVEILGDDSATPGRLRAFHVGQDGALRFFESTDGITGTNLAVGAAYRIDLSLGAQGARIYLNGTELTAAAIPAHTNGWNNAVPKYLGIWTDGASSPVIGALDQMRLWEGQLAPDEIATLEAAQSITLPGGDPSSIELTTIDAWAVDAASGGTIASATGGTMPTITIDYDPTDHVSGATGDKADWSAQFRDIALGSWSRVSSGDFRFTPGSNAGTSTGEYRVSDDGGATWSEWQDITIEVVARPPGPFYLAEDYSGTSGQKVQNAINAASNANGGTVTTLTRSTIWTAGNIVRTDGSFGYTWQENVHLLGLNLKQPNATRNGVECSENGNGECSGWSPGFWDDLVRGGTAWGASWNTSLRHQAVLCDFDGNATKMALHHTAGDQPTPNSNCGSCFKAGGGSGDVFNLQQQSGVRLRGTSDGNAANRRKALFKRSKVRRTCGDGVNNVGGMDIDYHDCIFEDTGTRGGPNLIGGNSKQEILRTIVRPGPDNLGGKVDHETETFGSRNVTLVHTDCQMLGLFDMIARSSTSGGSSYLIEGSEIGPGINLLARLATDVTVTFRGSTANPKGLIRYHKQGGSSGGTHPACRIGGWAGQSPHICTYHFEDQVFEAYGDPYIFNTALQTPGADLFEIRLGDSVDTGDAFRIEVVDCETRWRSQPAGATARLFRTTKQLTTTQVVQIDGLTIGTGFLQDAILLDGQRLEYRNVVHQGFPGSSIQQICPGAGQYVAL